MHCQVMWERYRRDLMPKLKIEIPMMPSHVQRYMWREENHAHLPCLLNSLVSSRQGCQNSRPQNQDKTPYQACQSPQNHDSPGFWGHLGDPASRALLFLYASMQSTFPTSSFLPKLPEYLHKLLPWVWHVMQHGMDCSLGMECSAGNCSGRGEYPEATGPLLIVTAQSYPALLQ